MSESTALFLSLIDKLPLHGLTKIKVDLFSCYQHDLVVLASIWLLLILLLFMILISIHMLISKQ
ncbi:hypothetical protein LINGRAPRIM_LOCUS983 [Linum grandiflorum]